jgi:hypothetical protein
VETVDEIAVAEEEMLVDLYGVHVNPCMPGLETEQACGCDGESQMLQSSEAEH